MSKELNHEEEQFLLRLARETLTQYLKRQKPRQPDTVQLSTILLEKRACFVTYTMHSELRGCIGSLYAEIPLYEDVMRRAIDAANDPRFSPMTLQELPQVHIEISVLSAMEKIASLDEFVLGKHGIVMEYQRRRAVFLPQVATEQGWSKEETLQHLSRKAGLASNAWQAKETIFYTFTSQLFEEKAEV
jgi:AmmeMemoRadiSam system protein A